MTPEEREQRRSEREAAQLARIREHARRVAAEAPPLTAEQAVRLRRILGVGPHARSHPDG